jgi:Amt family ammonium transporter
MNADTLAILNEKISALSSQIADIGAHAITKGDSTLATVSSLGDSTFMTENVWIMICALLVFIMNLGFATVESGLCRSKNTANILFKILQCQRSVSPPSQRLVLP